MRPTILGFLVCLSLTACTVEVPRRESLTPETVASPPFVEPTTLSPSPADAPLARPTPTPDVTSAPGSSSRTRGRWHRITTADGLCSDWPWLIGHLYLGTGTTTVCYPESMNDRLPWSPTNITWNTMVVPLGTRVTSMAKFAPGGGEEFVTDAGVCMRAFGVGGWTCQTPDNGFPHSQVQKVISLNTEPVYVLTNAIAYQEQTYSISQIAGTQDAHTTWAAVLDEYGSNPEIWVGTNKYGAVVIQPQTGKITHLTTADGLPGDEIRDVGIAKCPKGSCDIQDVWVATNNGVGHWNSEYWTTYTTADGLPSNDVRGVASQQKNTVWAATGGGAAWFDGRSWQAFTPESGLPEGDLDGVIAFADQAWFSTRGSGLLIFVEGQ